MRLGKMLLLWKVFREGAIFKIPTIFRMLKAVLGGSYKLDKSLIVYMILMMVYLIFPLDFIPDWIPFLGLIDDVGLLGVVLTKLMNEVDKFVLWERSERVDNR